MSSPERSRTRDQSLTRSRSSTSGGRAGAARAGATGRSETAESASGGVQVGRVGEGEGSPWGPFGQGEGPGRGSRDPSRGAGGPPVRGGQLKVRRARQAKLLSKRGPDLALYWPKLKVSTTEPFWLCAVVRKTCRGGGSGGASSCAATSSSSSCWDPYCDSHSVRLTKAQRRICDTGFGAREGSGNR